MRQEANTNITNNKNKNNKKEALAAATAKCQSHCVAENTDPWSDLDWFLRQPAAYCLAK